MAALLQTLLRPFSKKDIDNTPGFGTFVGVYVPTILMLFGVIVYLRLGWIVGQVGLATTILIISFTSLIVILSALSMAAIATNIEVGKGGVYYILSRSLGLEAGAAVGLPLYIKQTLSISFSIVGFAESLHTLIPHVSITTIGISTLIVLSLFAVTSLKGALKLQLIIFIALLLSFISFFSGGTVRDLPPDTFTPKEPLSMGFWTIFAIFFPAMTGIESSVSLSGDLKNPSKSLPRGTLLACLSAIGIYLAMSIFLVDHVSLQRLANDPGIMQEIAKWPQLIILGIWAATLSSALGGLLAAPRTLLALSEDAVISRFFAKTYGKANEPRIATITTILIAGIGIYFGTVNIIAPCLTMICLICYSVLNFCCAFEAYFESPSWRPSFHVHWGVSLLGGILSCVAMLMIDSGALIVAIIVMTAIFLVAKWRNIRGSWEDIRHGLYLFLSRFAILRLSYAEGGASRSWRPHFLVFTDKIEQHSNNLLRFSQAISRNKSFLTMASIVPAGQMQDTEKRKMEKVLSKRLEKLNIQALVQINFSDTIFSGMHQMIEHYGIGPLMPNTVVFGKVGQNEQAAEFAKVMATAHQKQCNIVIVNDTHVFSLPERGYFAPQVAGDIHIWWDDQNIKNSEFMLVLAYMLQRNPSWKRSKICIKGRAQGSFECQAKALGFYEFSQKRRLNLEIQMHEVENGEEDDFACIEKHSETAAMLFLSLKEFQDFSDHDAYARYLQSLSLRAKRFPPSAFVLCAQHTPLDTILQ